MKGSSPSQDCGEFVATGIKKAKMESVVFIKTTKDKVMRIIIIGTDLAKTILHQRLHVKDKAEPGLLTAGSPCSAHLKNDPGNAL